MTESEKFWETVYSRNIGKMIGICYRYTANRPLSEDLAHDAFLKAIDKSGSFEGKGCFEAWLRKIAVNHVLQYIRDQKRKKQIDDWLQREGNATQPEETYWHASLPEQAEFSETELLEAIKELPEHHRLVFNLYVIDNFTHADIGEILGISTGTSKSHLARARKKLKQLLDQKTEKKQRRKSVFLPFIFSDKHQRIDKLFRERFNNLEIPPKEISSPDLSEAHTIPVIRLQAFMSGNWIVAAASFAILLTAVNSDRIRNAVSIIHNQTKTSGLVKEVREEHEVITPIKNNSLVTGLKTATISSNSIIHHKQIKNKSMKNLDSLSLLLLASSSIMFDTAAQSTHEKDTLANTKKQIVTQNSITTRVITGGLASDFKQSKKQNGTFTASSLLWSSKNSELYLKGNVRVDIGDNHFTGDGSFTFLGSVHLLVVNGIPADQNSTIKLAKQQHYLTMLDQREATKKYGEKGRQGAVEIDLKNPAPSAD